MNYIFGLDELYFIIFIHTHIHLENMASFLLARGMKELNKW